MSTFVVDTQQAASNQLESDVFSPLFPHGNGNVDEGAATPLPYPGSASWRLQARAAHRPSGRTRNLSIFSLLVVATFPLLTTLLILAACRAGHTNKKQATGMNRRRLAEGGEPMDIDESYIIEQCLALEEELGISPTDPHLPSTSDRSRRIAELASLFSATAAEHEAMYARQVERGVQAVHQHAGSITDSSSGDQLLGSASAPELPTTSAAAASGGEGSNDAPSAVDPDAWADVVSVLSTQPEWKDLDVGTSSGSSETTRGKRKPVPIQPRPAASDQILMDISVIESHPFVRLPVLEPGVVPKNLFEAGAIGIVQMNTSAQARFLALRRLFAKKTLNQEEADELADAVEELANKTARRARGSVRQTRPLFAASTLGTYFLMFDYLLAAIQVLYTSIKLPPWWKTFINSFDSDYYFSDPNPTCRESARFNTRLANSLIAAIKIYKMGVRPSAHFIIELKRQLFFGKHGPARFRDPQWDPWRADDINFWKTQGALPCCPIGGNEDHDE
ncbi:uncharacterized protein EMH_0044350 [Eimeria mitis]|uniref:Uncharacterized protein n=1 Tax=Eimeria mitis TaxID=44415 RepID=U6K4A2_9EIME|nr:uncharacterized protein EMH_0044350 [Eimeria mitis]CDJ32509.1 hypothetical protein, conserved [Eimeria mitis]